MYIHIHLCTFQSPVVALPTQYGHLENHRPIVLPSSHLLPIGRACVANIIFHTVEVSVVAVKNSENFQKIIIIISQEHKKNTSLTGETNFQKIK